MTISSCGIDQFSDQELLKQIERAAQDERGATAQLIALLMELDTRRLYLAQGYSSLFTFCTQALHLSEHAAYGRIEAARAARRFPLILENLVNGDVTLTAVGLLAPHLTPANHAEVLDKARHKSKREIEHLVACLHPRPDVVSAVRKLPERERPLESQQSSAVKQLSVEAASAEPSAHAVPAARRPEVKPLSPGRYKIQMTVNRETYERLCQAQDLLRHVIPSGDPAAIFDRALTCLLAQLRRTKLAVTDRPRTARETAHTSRHVPAAVKRAVWQRDGGRCAFRGAEGRCTETGFVEYHHVVPFAADGETTSKNIELRCRAHNAFEAEEYFGTRQQPLAWQGTITP